MLALGSVIAPKDGYSPNAHDIDTLYKVALYIALVVFVGVEGMLLYSLIRFRARRGAVPAQIRGNTRMGRAPAWRRSRRRIISASRPGRSATRPFAPKAPTFTTISARCISRSCTASSMRSSSARKEASVAAGGAEAGSMFDMRAIQNGSVSLQEACRRAKCHMSRFAALRLLLDPARSLGHTTSHAAYADTFIS